MKIYMFLIFMLFFSLKTSCMEDSAKEQAVNKHIEEIKKREKAMNKPCQYSNCTPTARRKPITK